MRKLYEIGADLEALSEMMTDLDGEIPEGEIGAAIEEWFDRLGEERDEKIRRYCALIEMMIFSAEACAEEVRRLGKLKRANENGALQLKDRLKQFFEQHGIQKLDLGTFRPRIQVNGSAPLIVPQPWATEPASAPEAFHKVAIELNTQAVREALAEAGADLCPECGDRVARINGDPATDAVLLVQCRSCDWTGEPHETAHIGERGTHLRLR